MPTISQRGIDMPASPIRKLVPLANRAKAKGTVVYHLNIGQPDLATPEVALRAAHHLDREVLEYSPSEGILSFRKKLVEYYHKFNIDVCTDDIIITTGGFTYFQNAKQVSRYLGICPTYEQSGTSVNIKGHINRNGDAYTRGLLYIAAWPASRFNAQCKETYTRLRQNGKSGKLAMIAVANKLIRQAFAVVAHDKEYVDGFVSNRP